MRRLSAENLHGQNIHTQVAEIDASTENPSLTDLNENLEEEKQLTLS